MKIVALDGETLNPGDLSWEEFEKLGEITVYERTPMDQILERSKDADILLTNKTPIREEVIAKFPRLRYIGVMATGYDCVDVNAASDKGIVVTNVPEYGTDSVAQMAIALLLELCHHVQLHSDAVLQGEWSRSKDFCFTLTTQIELKGKIMGIVGFGRIGKQVARIANALGMKVIVSDKIKQDIENMPELEWVEKNELLQRADVISLHCPLFPDTKEMINKESIAEMKSSAFIINTSRGGLIKDAELAEALNNGNIAGAGLDVLSVEPPIEGNPLIGAKNCIITPHIAWATKEARGRLMNTLLENLKAFINDKPQNVVS